MKNFLYRFMARVIPVSFAVPAAMAHEIGLPHQHTFIEQLYNSIMQPDHLLILIGIVLVVYLHITRSVRK